MQHSLLWARGSEKFTAFWFKINLDLTTFGAFSRFYLFQKAFEEIQGSARCFLTWNIICILPEYLFLGKRDNKIRLKCADIFGTLRKRRTAGILQMTSFLVHTKIIPTGFAKSCPEPQSCHQPYRGAQNYIYAFVPIPCLLLYLTSK